MRLMRHVAGGLLVALAIVMAPASRADAPTAVGWWWSGNVEGLPVQPPPPDVPDGGLYVAGGLSGASGVSALRFNVPSGSRDPVLTLQVAAGSGNPVIGACPTTAEWEPAAGGPFSARPNPDCERGSVPAEVAPAGDVVRIALGTLVDGETIDIVLLPGKDPATGAGATFDVSFDPPGPSALTFAEPSPSASPTVSTTPASSGTTVVFTPTPPTPAAISPPATAPVAFVPAENIDASPTDPAVVSTPGVGAGKTITATDETDGRVAGVLLAVLVAGTWLLLTRTTVGARLSALSGGSADNVRGVGRFAVPRDANPPSL